MDQRRYGQDADERRLIAALQGIEPRFRPMRVLLFGSRARGDYVQESDWDLIVISPAFAGVPFLRRGAEVAMAIFRADVGAAEVLCYSPEEFQAKSSELGIVGTAAGEGRFLI